MKTIQELYDEVLESDALKGEFLEASKNREGLKTFLEKHDCGSTAEEAEAFLKGQWECEGELEDRELAAIAGGKPEYSPDAPNDRDINPLSR